MKNFSTWLLVTFMAMFWGLRIIIACTYELGIEFWGLVPINETIEIILLFVVLVCMLLIIKRKIIGALIYLLSHGMYFGTDLIAKITTFTTKIETTISNTDTYFNAFISLIGIGIPIVVLFDLLLDKNRKENPKDKKTDWFYKNEQFDRKRDERSDKNNYRIL